jgi:hypothetical protein
MSIFSKIHDAIFGHKAQAAPVPSPAEQTGTAPQPVPTQAAPTEAVDVEANLNTMAQGKDLNWRTSIVDLLKLIGVDPSYENRKDLATELGDTNYSGSAEDNIALHKAVMNKLAENGGKVPA